MYLCHFFILELQVVSDYSQEQSAQSESSLAHSECMQTSFLQNTAVLSFFCFFFLGGGGEGGRKGKGSGKQAGEIIIITVWVEMAALTPFIETSGVFKDVQLHQKSLSGLILPEQQAAPTRV